MESILLGIALITAFGIFIWVGYMLIAEFLAVAYVPSDPAPVLQVLKKFGLDKNKVFWDLGSGDGRIVMATAERFHCRAEGIEINPLLILWSRFESKINPAGSAEYMWGNFWNKDLGRPDFIYCYLSPRAMKKIGEKFLRESKKGTILISRAFTAKNLQKNLVEVITINQRKIFVYKK